MEAPILYEEPFVRSLDVDFKQWLSPGESRRMGKLLKRALATSLTAMKASGVEHPDAIITGTGLGCIENTENLLTHLCFEGEENCKPTPFMQSTHNTISSLVSIHTLSHGYNATYAHKEASFDCALEDAWMQLQLGRIHTALVGGQDEMTPQYFGLLCKTGYLGNPGQVAGETAVSMMLDAKPSDKALCRITLVRRCYRPSPDTLTQVADEIGAVDAIVIPNIVFTSSPLMSLFARPEAPALLQYKNIFGESYTAYGLGIYAAAQVLSHQTFPDAMLLPDSARPAKLQRLLVVNESGGKDFTFTLLEQY